MKAICPYCDGPDPCPRSLCARARLELVRAVSAGERGDMAAHEAHIREQRRLGDEAWKEAQAEAERRKR
jgi:hypothetical protein